MSPTGPLPFGPGRRRKPPVYGGQPLPLPLVAAIGVNNQTSTSANLVGSANPQGQTGICWFAYGTTPQLGSLSPSQPVSGNLPLTITEQISGLASGTVYYYALVAQTTAGQVTSTPLTFTAGTVPSVTNASSPTIPASLPAVSVPHWQFPITFTPQSGVGVVEQDSLEEIAGNVAAICACPVGACPELPTFGIPEMAMGLAPLETAPLLAAIREWEPRATETAVASALGDPAQGIQQVNLTTQYGGTQ